MKCALLALTADYKICL